MFYLQHETTTFSLLCQGHRLLVAAIQAPNA
jgi:hypothetical protein